MKNWICPVCNVDCSNEKKTSCNWIKHLLEFHSVRKLQVEDVPVSTVQESEAPQLPPDPLDFFRQQLNPAASPLMAPGNTAYGYVPPYPYQTDQVYPQYPLLEPSECPIQPPLQYAVQPLECPQQHLPQYPIQPLSPGEEDPPQHPQEQGDYTTPPVAYQPNPLERKDGEPDDLASQIKRLDAKLEKGGC